MIGLALLLTMSHVPASHEQFFCLFIWLHPLSDEWLRLSGGYTEENSPVAWRVAALMALYVLLWQKFNVSWISIGHEGQIFPLRTHVRMRTIPSNNYQLCRTRSYLTDCILKMSSRSGEIRMESVSIHEIGVCMEFHTHEHNFPFEDI